MTIDYTYFKEKLETEKKLLEKELEAVGRRNPDNPSDWEARSTEKDESQADDNITADNIEGYEDNVAIVGTLETRYQELQKALGKIEKSTYGLCEVCGKEIESDRLEANPSSSTCKEHLE